MSFNVDKIEEVERCNSTKCKLKKSCVRHITTGQYDVQIMPVRNFYNHDTHHCNYYLSVFHGDDVAW